MIIFLAKMASRNRDAYQIEPRTPVLFRLPGMFELDDEWKMLKKIYCEMFLAETYPSI